MTIFKAKKIADQIKRYQNFNLMNIRHLIDTEKRQNRTGQCRNDHFALV